MLLAGARRVIGATAKRPRGLLGFGEFESLIGGPVGSGGFDFLEIGVLCACGQI